MALFDLEGERADEYQQLELFFEGRLTEPG